MSFLFAPQPTNGPHPCHVRRRGPCGGNSSNNRAQGCSRSRNPASHPAFPFNTIFNDFVNTVDVEIANQAAGRPQGTIKRVIKPKFDIIETETAYILEGELPGVSDKKSVDIEFVDAQTVVVKGEIVRRVRGLEDGEDVVVQDETRTEKKEEQLPSYQEQDHLIDVSDKKVSVEDDEKSLASQEKEEDAVTTRSHSPSVQDVVDESDAGSDKDDFEVIDAPFATTTTASRTTTAPTPVLAAKPSSPSPASPVSTTTLPSANGTPVATAEASQAPEQPKEDTTSSTTEKRNIPRERFWVAERAIGTFQRTFQFQTLVDQDAVTAHLENGLLRIVVPKREKVVRNIRIA